MASDFRKGVLQATKWSTIAEVVSKLFSPLSTMVLARLLTPEAFGTVATVSMVIAFAELFTDAGFQKYIIQHEFESEKKLNETTNVAFVTNLFIAIVIWLFIIVLRDVIASTLGDDSLGVAISVACVSLPLSAFSSIQIALFKRKFDFKTLFTIRMVSLIIPLIITIPFAVVFRNYWALIIGSIAIKVTNAIFLTLKSRWKPRLQFSIILLRNMISFTSWTIAESVLVWLTTYIGILIVGMKLNAYYLGIFQTSITLVVQIVTLAVSALTPVLFSTLSRLQNNEKKFKMVFLFFQSTVALIAFPLGFILLAFQDFVTIVILGDQWREGAGFIGLLGFTISFNLVFSQLSSEAFRAKGKPRLSLMLQLSYLVFYIPAIMIAVDYGFKTLYMTHALSKIILLISSWYMMYKFLNINFLDMLRGTIIKIVAGSLMYYVALLFQNPNSSLFENASLITFCLVLYTGVLICFKSERENIKALLVFLKESL